MEKIARNEKRFVGLDVHAEMITVAVATKDGDVHAMGSISNRPESVKRLVAKLDAGGAWRACYEAGPTGYALYWQLAKLGRACEVIAPTWCQRRRGIGSNRQARCRRLARCYQAGG
jgi:hypothetical protein